MPSTTANGIKIEYETFGDSSNPAVLLIAGLGCQMIYWDEQLCGELAENEYFVIRFDNRDTGLSSKFEEAGVPDLQAMMHALVKGQSVEVPYTISDMAEDAVALLDALDIGMAHVCGMSMGSLIAQMAAVRHPSRITSLISIYGSTGNPELPQPDHRVMEALFFEPLPTKREDYIDRVLHDVKIITGYGFSFDEPWCRDLAGRAFDRCFYPQGNARNLAAILHHGNHTSMLASVTIPTLVIHGSCDPLVPIEAGKEIAASISGARLVIIEGMGHDLPHNGPWIQIIREMVSFIKNI